LGLEDELVIRDRGVGEVRSGDRSWDGVRSRKIYVTVVPYGQLKWVYLPRIVLRYMGHRL